MCWTIVWLITYCVFVEFSGEDCAGKPQRSCKERGGGSLQLEGHLERSMRIELDVILFSCCALDSHRWYRCSFFASRHIVRERATVSDNTAANDCTYNAIKSRSRLFWVLPKQKQAFLVKRWNSLMLREKPLVHLVQQKCSGPQADLFPAEGDACLEVHHLIHN